MILKIRRNETEGGWCLIDNIVKIDYYIEQVPNSENGVAHVIVTDGNGCESSFLFGDTTYLMNNDGKTIEKINNKGFLSTVFD